MNEGNATPNQKPAGEELPKIIEKSIKFQQYKPSGPILRQFRFPKTLCAILIDKKDEPSRMLEGNGGLRCYAIPTDVRTNEREEVEEFLKRSEKGSKTPFIEFTKENLKIRWRPGLAAIVGPITEGEEVLPAIVDFSHLEEMLRDLESDLEEIEAEAPLDVQFSYRIRRADKRHWRRITQTMEKLYRMRLKFARLEPALRKPAKDLSLAGRKVGHKLLELGDIEDRTESFGDRLEACEDLYEGANDRISDYRMYRDGHLLEILIILLLLLEVILMAGELYYRHLEYVDATK